MSQYVSACKISTEKFKKDLDTPEESYRIHPLGKSV